MCAHVDPKRHSWEYRKIYEESKPIKCLYQGYNRQGCTFLKRIPFLFLLLFLRIRSNLQYSLSRDNFINFETFFMELIILRNYYTRLSGYLGIQPVELTSVRLRLEKVRNTTSIHRFFDSPFFPYYILERQTKIRHLWDLYVYRKRRKPI